MKLIDADLLIDKIKYDQMCRLGYLNHCREAGCDLPDDEVDNMNKWIQFDEKILNLIDEILIDSPPKKIGKWKPVSGYVMGHQPYKCPFCHTWCDDLDWRFCPKCGLKMGENKHEID